ncbi:PAS domain-containing protein, partial [Raoultella terrigena]|uniref:PAS domain-containing protein n=1 Tax=Raoultella terrigena TaxID=577 RepID=UPI0013301DBD
MSYDDVPLPFRALVECSPDLIAFFGLDGRVRYINDAGRALVGMPTDLDVTTTVVSDYLAEGVEASFVTRRPELLGSGTIAATNVLRHWQGGEPIPVDQSTFVVRGDDGEPVA